MRLSAYIHDLRIAEGLIANLIARAAYCFRITIMFWLLFIAVRSENKPDYETKGKPANCIINCTH